MIQNGRGQTSPITTALLSIVTLLSIGIYLRFAFTTFGAMRVDLDQIEFYHGPSPLSPFTSAKSVTGGHAPIHTPRYFQQPSPARFGFRSRRDEALLEQPPPVTGTTHEWNIFDFEINNVYVPTRPEIAKDIEPPVATDIPAACHIPVGFGPSASAFPEPVPLTDSAKTIPYPAKLDHLDHIIRRNDLPCTLT